MLRNSLQFISQRQRSRIIPPKCHRADTGTPDSEVGSVSGPELAREKGFLTLHAEAVPGGAAGPWEVNAESG